MKRELVIRYIHDLLTQIMPKGASVFLFGSQARGDYSEHSDWDILILLNQAESVNIMQRGNYTFPIYQLAAEIGVEINPVIYTESDWQLRKFTPFYKNVINDSIKIWG